MTMPEIPDDPNIERWRSIYDSKVLDPIPDALSIRVAMRHYLFDKDMTPYMDFTGGGGVMPLGHGHEMVRKSIQELAKNMYQTAPFGEHIHGIHMEYLSWLGKHFNPEWRFQFFTSESTARSLVPTVMNVGEHDVRWINGEPPESLSWTSEGETPKVVVVSPINPTTYRALSSESMKWIFAQRDRGAKIVWDETVAGMGWRGHSVFNTPFYADAVILGGALGGGLPLAAIGGTDQLKRVSPGRLSGSAFAYTAGLHTLRQLMVITSNSDIAAVSERLLDEIIRIQKLFPKDLHDEVLGEGLLRSLRFRNGKLATEFVNECRKGGALLGHSGPHVRITVPLVCQLGDIDELASIMTEALMKVREKNDGQ